MKSGMAVVIPGGWPARTSRWWDAIVAIADVFDALTSCRPYKDAWDRERTLNYPAGRCRQPL